MLCKSDHIWSDHIWAKSCSSCPWGQCSGVCVKCNNRCISFLDTCLGQYDGRNSNNIHKDTNLIKIFFIFQISDTIQKQYTINNKENSYETRKYPEPLDVENQASASFLVPIVVFMLVCSVLQMLVCIYNKRKLTESRQDGSNNDLLYNQSRANRPLPGRGLPSLIDMEPTASSGSLTVPITSTNIQVQ